MRLIGFLLLFLTCNLSVAQEPFIREWRLHEQGAPVKVNDLLQDVKGYIWLAADDGVYRFNGRTFTHLLDNIKQPVTAIARYGETIVVGYSNGLLGLVNRDTVVSMQLHGYRSFSSITSLYSMHPQMLWITTEEDGLLFMLGNIGMQITTEEGLADNFLYNLQQQQDEVIVGTDRGINSIRWKDGKPSMTAFNTIHGLPDNIVRVVKQIAGTKTFWIGTQEGGLAILDNNDKHVYRLQAKEPWGYGQVNDILPINTNEAWVATEDGYMVQVLRTGKDSLTATPYHYPGKKLKKLLRDRSDNIWCAANDGLIMNTALYARQHRLPSPYSLQAVTAIACDDRMNLWYSQEKELYQLPLRPIGMARKVSSLPAAITSLHYIKGRLWIGTLGEGLYSYTQQKGLRHIRHPMLEGGHILSITGRDEMLWVSSLNGVAQMKMDEVADSMILMRSHGKETGAGSDYVYQIYIDRKEYIWMATDGGGVRMWDGKKMHSWSQKQGLTASVFYSLAEDVDGNIWAASLGQGLFHYDGKRWQRLDEKNGLQDADISALMATGNGEMIVVNRDGVDQWYSASGQFRNYNLAMGVGIDTTSRVLNCIAIDKQGSVILPFGQGFAFFPAGSKSTDIAPKISIQNVSIFFKPVVAGTKAFNHTDNHISFRYEGISFATTERLYYRYRLLGYGKDWVQTADETITFPQLRPGRYNFQVQTSLSPDFSRAAMDSYAFTIASPLWQRWWAMLLIAALLTTAIFAYIRQREKNIRRLSQLQRERMMFEYEHLKSQVNPHFLFNSLNTLASIIEEDKETAVNYTVQLSDFYRSILAFRDKDLITLGEELRIMQHYMHIQQSRFGAALLLKMHTPSELLSIKHIVPLALQLLVENAIKHNIVSVSQPLLITITATPHNITVRNPLQPKISPEKGSGLGLINIQSRYKLLTDQKVFAGPTATEYIVTLPLL